MRIFTRRTKRQDSTESRATTSYRTPILCQALCQLPQERSVMIKTHPLLSRCSYPVEEKQSVSLLMDIIQDIEYVCMCQLFSHVQLFGTPRTVAHQAPRSMEFSRKNTVVGCHFLLQGIFLTQGSNLGLLYCRQILYHLCRHGCWYMCFLIGSFLCQE